MLCSVEMFCQGATTKHYMCSRVFQNTARGSGDWIMISRENVSLKFSFNVNVNVDRSH